MVMIPERMSGSVGRRDPWRRRSSPLWRRSAPWAAGRGPEDCRGCRRPPSRQSEIVGQMHFCTWKGEHYQTKTRTTHSSKSTFRLRAHENDEMMNSSTHN